MKLLLFSGFLGSGKTTLILALAKQLAAEGRTTCFIVNEVGEIGVDQEVMRDGGLEVYEITAGCICCQIGVDLVRTVQEVAERYCPEVVIVEASGVATPKGVLDSLEYLPPGALEQVHVVSVVDPTRFAALHEVMEPLIEAQIRGADRLVITKTDEATEEELRETRETVSRLNEPAALHEVSARNEAALASLIAELARMGAEG